MPDQSNKKNKGFTIVESLVAITILVMVVVSASRAVQTGISAYIFSKDQIIAFYLAQEAFEQIRNLRDENALSVGGHWLAGISENAGNPCWFGNNCYVDTINSNGTGIGPYSCGGACQPLRQQATSNFFGYNGTWAATIFTRTITLTQANANEITVLVTVDWSKGGTPKQFRAKENLLNWQ
ncbi:MAG: prepilin-type N-terminal cleavage/methylation domain-containing protein [Patescibacteria group bacterium]